MEVWFKRTGERRYAVEIVSSDEVRQTMSPAPGYDDDIPHDLVHYIVEAELGLASGVFGRAAKGGGTFVSAAGEPRTARELARERRKQQKRERAFRSDDASVREMETSERLAALCDVAWRRRHGQRRDPLRQAPKVTSEEDAPRIERVVKRLDAIAPMWRTVPVGGALVFFWPGVAPTVSRDTGMARSSGSPPASDARSPYE